MYVQTQLTCGSMYMRRGRKLHVQCTLCRQRTLVVLPEERKEAVRKLYSVQAKYTCSSPQDRVEALRSLYSVQAKYTRSST